MFSIYLIIIRVKLHSLRSVPVHVVQDASYVIPVPMGNKVKSSDCTCLFSSGRKRAM